MPQTRSNLRTLAKRVMLLSHPDKVRVEGGQEACFIAAKKLYDEIKVLVGESPPAATDFVDSLREAFGQTGVPQPPSGIRWRRSRRGNMTANMGDGEYATAYFNEDEGVYKWCFERQHIGRFVSEEEAMRDFEEFYND